MQSFRYSFFIFRIFVSHFDYVLLCHAIQMCVCLCVCVYFLKIGIVIDSFVEQSSIISYVDNEKKSRALLV